MIDLPRVYHVVMKYLITSRPGLFKWLFCDTPVQRTSARRHPTDSCPLPHKGDITFPLSPNGPTSIQQTIARANASASFQRGRG